MFAINYMSSKKRIVSRIEDETGKLGTQSRIYDCNTGLYTRILANNNLYSFCETGIGYNGILQRNYRFYEVLDCNRREGINLISKITSKIDSLGNLSSDEINFIFQNGFLEFIAENDIEFGESKEFQILLKADRFLKQFESKGKIGYDEVLQEITNALGFGELSDEDRKIMEQLKAIYENDMFRQQRVNDEVIQEEQRKRSTQHTAQEISEDLQEIGRSEIEEKALAEIIDGEEIKEVNDREEK